MVRKVHTATFGKRRPETRREWDWALGLRSRCTVIWPPSQLRIAQINHRVFPPISCGRGDDGYDDDRDTVETPTPRTRSAFSFLALVVLPSEYIPGHPGTCPHRPSEKRVRVRYKVHHYPLTSSYEAGKDRMEKSAVIMIGYVPRYVYVQRVMSVPVGGCTACQCTHYVTVS